MNVHFASRRLLELGVLVLKILHIKLPAQSM